MKHMKVLNLLEDHKYLPPKVFKIKFKISFR